MSNIAQKVTIITVTYNSSQVIGNFLRSMPSDVKVVVVDNCSKDSTIDEVRKVRPHTEVIASDENLGFGRANNLALSKVTTEYAFIINPDTELVGNCVDELVKSADLYSDAAIIVPKIYQFDGCLQESYKLNIFKRERLKAKFIEPEGDICAEFFSGAAMLFKVVFFQGIGYFDDNIFLFYEDDDICMKVRDRGYGLVLAHKAHIKHMVGQSMPVNLRSIWFKNFHMMWSRIYLQKKYHGCMSMVYVAAEHIIKNLFKALGYLLVLNFQKSLRSLARVCGAVSYLKRPV